MSAKLKLFTWAYHLEELQMFWFWKERTRRFWRWEMKLQLQAWWAHFPASICLAAIRKAFLFLGFVFWWLCSSAARQIRIRAVFKSQRIEDWSNSFKCGKFKSFSDKSVLYLQKSDLRQIVFEYQKKAFIFRCKYVGTGI